MNASPSPLLALYRIVLVVLGLVVLVAWLSERPWEGRDRFDQRFQSLSALTYGDGWPFRVDRAMLECVDGRYLTVRAAPDGGISDEPFALDDAAKRVAEHRGWRDVREIQLRNADVSPLLDVGRRLCD
ncbi:hypothetical protein [Deinococcus yavapaiensis]|uniref:Uncharacterized protein n=1 Tax=Deinococcus yavapaiensis KR-236 TaxID=694435 RepID=A0A318S3U2_9DEIO|nr:hypothetical protein [Deinococcus yavapaiensis]PYE49435.1 hypothetical protein DES52_12329 [Deinococcus yavapaiensis KR-236]